MMVMPWTRWVLLGAWVVSVTGCGPGEAPPAPPPATVTVAHPQVGEVTEYYEYTGTLAAVQQVEVRARVSGYLEEVAFEPATEVDQGALLFEIEHEPYDIAVSTAQAKVAQADALLKEAQSIYDKVTQAFDANAATPAEKIEAQAKLEQRQAERQEAQAALRQAKLNLEYTYVRSPIQGRVSRNLADPGDLVGYSDPTLLTTVVQMDPIWAYFDVSERIVLEYLQRRREGVVDPARDVAELALANDDPGQYPFHGYLDFVDNTVDATTGTIQVRAVFPNANKALFPGLFVRVRVPFGKLADAVMVEENAIGTGLEGKYLLLLGEHNIIERRTVELGPRSGPMRVVLKGITPDDRYVVNGQQKARPGRPVTPQMQSDQPKQPASESPHPDPVSQDAP